MFSGFPKDLFRFLKGLEVNNEKAWMEAHKHDYEAHLMTPARAFVDAFGPAATAALGVDLQAIPKMNQSIRRVARDVRFSKDKRPYSPRLHLLFWRTGKPNKGPGYHMVIHPDRIGIGAGFFGFPPAVLEAYRKAAAADGAELVKAVERVEQMDAGALGPPELKTVPKGYQADGRVADLLKHKGIVMRREYDIPSEIFTSQAIDWAIERLAPYRPLMDWLVTHLGQN